MSKINKFYYKPKLNYKQIRISNTDLKESLIFNKEERETLLKPQFKTELINQKIYVKQNKKGE